MVQRRSYQTKRERVFLLLSHRSEKAICQFLVLYHRGWRCAKLKAFNREGIHRKRGRVREKKGVKSATSKGGKRNKATKREGEMHILGNQN